MKENDSKKQEKRELSPAALQKRRKMLVYPLFFLLFAAAMGWIFSSSTAGSAKADDPAGFNACLPDPHNKGIIGDKRDAYQQEAMKRKAEEKKRSLQDLAFTLLGEKREEREEQEENGRTVMPAERTEITSSTQAYHDLHSRISHWNDPTATAVGGEPSQLSLQRRIEDLERKAGEDGQQTAAEDRQLEMIERSYRIAAQYMQGVQTQGQPAADREGQNATATTPATAAPPPQKRKVQAASSLQPDVVSLLTATTTEAQGETQGAKNTISASIHRTQTLSGTAGQEVQLRLSEDMEVQGQRIPRGTLITGTARMGGERLFIAVSSLQYAGSIIPLELQVYDMDGQAGLFIPGSEEINALNEMAAGMGPQMGPSISISNNAASQLAADLGKGVIQGTSQYVGRKLRTLRLRLKAGHQVLLVPPLP